MYLARGMSRGSVASLRPLRRGIVARGRDEQTFIGDDGRGCGIARGDITHARSVHLDGNDLHRWVYRRQLESQRPDKRNAYTH
jgi:hypothetical protein